MLAKGKGILNSSQVILELGQDRRSKSYKGEPSIGPRALLIGANRHQSLKSNLCTFHWPQWPQIVTCKLIFFLSLNHKVATHVPQATAASCHYQHSKLDWIKVPGGILDNVAYQMSRQKLDSKNRKDVLCWTPPLWIFLVISAQRLMADWQIVRQTLSATDEKRVEGSVSRTSAPYKLGQCLLW